MINILKTNGKINIRNYIKPEDITAIKKILESSGFFYDYEIRIAIELLEETLKKGEASGYYFLIAEIGGITAGYTCFGEIPCTKDSFDLYWIAVDNTLRGGGIGKMLLAETENVIKSKNGKRIYIETSSREIYQPTRAFYLKCGYNEAARLTDYYGIGDDKVIYEKKF